MNGTQEYYNARIAAGGGDPLLRYNTVTKEVTHQQFLTELVLLTTRDTSLTMLNNETIDLAETVEEDTGAFTISAHVPSPGMDYTTVEAGTYHIRMYYNFDNSQNARVTLAVRVNGSSVGSIRINTVIQVGSVDLIYYLPQGAVLDFTGGGFNGATSAEYWGGVVIYRLLSD